ncbi:hypothetical protein E2542_SST17144 [Spatholobus suberectus]|nr:hypothetical protein E2542_SST17144 [Spatholobus suberectus]
MGPFSLSSAAAKVNKKGNLVSSDLPEALASCYCLSFLCIKHWLSSSFACAWARPICLANSSRWQDYAFRSKYGRGEICGGLLMAGKKSKVEWHEEKAGRLTEDF